MKRSRATVFWTYRVFWRGRSDRQPQTEVIFPHVAGGGGTLAVLFNVHYREPFTRSFYDKSGKPMFCGHSAMTPGGLRGLAMPFGRISRHI